MQEIVVATRNKGKILEINKLLNIPGLHLRNILDFSSVPETIEDGDTLEANSLKKAKEAFAATHLPSIADDSGLEVYSLDMRPGVYSARYSGENATYEQNNKKLLYELQDIPTSKRTARFRCVVAFVANNVEMVFEGICNGKIIIEPRGNEGFGYDSLFVPDNYGQTFAELPLSIKNAISHRAKAFLSLHDFLLKYFSL